MSQNFVSTLYPNYKSSGLLVLIALLLSLVAGVRSEQVGLLMLGLLSALIFFNHPTWAVWLTLGLLFFGNQRQIPALVFWGRYLPTVGISIFILVVMARWFLTKDSRWQGQVVIVGYALFAVVLLISALYNRSPSRDIVLSLLTNLRYPLFFIALINLNLKSDFYRSVMKMFVVFSLLQVPVAIVQFALGAAGDAVTGTMGANPILVAATLVSQCILLAHWQATGKHSRYYMLAIVALIIPTLLGDIRIGLILFPFLCFFIIMRHYGVRRLFRSLALGVVILLLSGGIVFGIASAVPTVREFLVSWPWFSVNYWQNEFDWRNPKNIVYSSMGRFTIIPFSFPFLLEEPMRLFVGFGPEAAQGGLLSATFSQTGPNISNMGIVCVKLIVHEAQCREPQSFKTLMEFGLLGTLLYMIPLFWAWQRMARPLGKASFIESRFIWLQFEGISVLYIVLAFWYIGVWRLDIYSFAFWFAAAAAHVEVKQQRQLTEHIGIKS